MVNMPFIGNIAGMPLEVENPLNIGKHEVKFARPANTRSWRSGMRNLVLVVANSVNTVVFYSFLDIRRTFAFQSVGRRTG